MKKNGKIMLIQISIFVFYAIAFSSFYKLDKTRNYEIAQFYNFCVFFQIVFNFVMAVIKSKAGLKDLSSAYMISGCVIGFLMIPTCIGLFG